MKLNIENLPYRNKSLGIIIDKEKNFLLVQLIDYGENDWNFPGGGIENGEDPENALLRELFEELGTDKFKVLKKSRETIKYDWPESVILKRLEKTGKTYRGQNQNVFLVEFNGNRDEIKSDPGEIRKTEWAEYEDLKNYLNFPRQWEIIEKVLNEFDGINK